MLRTASTIALALTLAGCMTFRTTELWHDVNSDGSNKPFMTVQIENSGWYLFDCIPLVCGNPAKPNGNSSRWFSNTVTLQNNLAVLDGIMEEYGADTLSNLDSRETDDFYYFFILYRRACHTSAVLFRDGDQK
ncbi:MAG: hypothetical protein IJ802_02905 [Kiritimatiellae bacterium]|nr:hypothetical protein [Kiritimatiellia bacterium]